MSNLKDCKTCKGKFDSDTGFYTGRNVCKTCVKAGRRVCGTMTPAELCVKVGDLEADLDKLRDELVNHSKTAATKEDLSQQIDKVLNAVGETRAVLREVAQTTQNLEEQLKEIKQAQIANELKRQADQADIISQLQTRFGWMDPLIVKKSV